MTTRYLLWNVANVTNTLGLPEDCQNIQSILTEERKQGKTASAAFKVQDRDDLAQLERYKNNPNASTQRYERLPDTLFVAVYDSELSGFSEALETGRLFDFYRGQAQPKLTFNIEQLFESGFAQRISDAVSLAAHAIALDPDKLEIVIVDAEQPDRVWSFLHDYFDV